MSLCIISQPGFLIHSSLNKGQYGRREVLTSVFTASHICAVRFSGVDGERSNNYVNEVGDRKSPLVFRIPKSAVRLLAILLRIRKVLSSVFEPEADYND